MKYSKHNIGYKAELKAAGYFANNGYEVFFPVSNQGTVDLVIVNGQDVQRVQVKAAYWMKRPSGCSYLQATTRKGCGTTREVGYSKDDCDCLCIVAEEAIWIIPIEEFPDVKTINLLKGQKYRASRLGAFDIDKYKRDY